MPLPLRDATSAAKETASSRPMRSNAKTARSSLGTPALPRAATGDIGVVEATGRPPPSFEGRGEFGLLGVARISVEGRGWCVAKLYSAEDANGEASRWTTGRGACCLLLLYCGAARGTKRPVCDSCANGRLWIIFSRISKRNSLEKYQLENVVGQIVIRKSLGKS